MTNGLLLEYKILKIVILNLVVAFSAYCQSEIIDLQATHSELSCGANFAYQSKIRIQNDTISIFQSMNGAEVIGRNTGIRGCTGRNP